MADSKNPENAVPNSSVQKPAKVTEKADKKPNFFKRTGQKISKFYKDYRSEFKKLIWPTREQLVKNSAVVLLSIIIVGAFLAALDFGLTKGIYGLKDLVDYIMPVR